MTVSDLIQALANYAPGKEVVLDVVKFVDGTTWGTPVAVVTTDENYVYLGTEKDKWTGTT